MIETLEETAFMLFIVSSWLAIVSCITWLLLHAID